MAFGNEIPISDIYIPVINMIYETGHKSWRVLAVNREINARLCLSACTLRPGANMHS